VSHVLTEVEEGALPAPPGFEHGLHVQAIEVGPFRRCRSRGWVQRVVSSSGEGRRAQPVLDRAQGHFGGEREAFDGHLRVPFAQLEHEATKAVGVALPLAATVDAARVPHHEAEDLACERVVVIL
jgi:hypothetical protein